uniref:protein LTV1 homolog n=1 Tax=Ciona intestinalis TaxID=7719 RepID=UPI000180B636|nr:protein LTV1 homolog [Ciona intestinalis]|eukprot:XP_002128747.1 protein LTV1 homolog [Ciona intestinalis]
MPRRNKKQFIDKKKSVTFNLVHRSQKDPLAADEDAPQRVLIPINESAPLENPEQRESRIENQKTFGIGFEDDYDYLQHLKPSSRNQEAILVPKDGDQIHMESVDEENIEIIKDDTVLRLPSIVFASHSEGDVGLVHRAVPNPRGPQPSWDPDVVAGLDEDFDFNDPDNELEDDFMAMACEEGESDDVDSDAESCDSGSCDLDEFSDEETKSRFTAYSITSSVMGRNEQLTLLDDRFEKFFESYDEPNIGELCQVEIEGGIPVGDVGEMEGLELLLGLGGGVKEGEEERIRPTLPSNLDNDDDDIMVTMVMEKPRDNWDCESILSTYSTIYNRPKLIQDPPKIKISPTTGLPLNSKPHLTKKQLKSLEPEVEKPRVIVRGKDETREEKTARKAAVKEMKKERRQEKKATKKAFRAEQTRQNLEIININRNLSGVRIH